MSKKPTVRDCSGCHNDFYNGHNDLDVKRCWSLASAIFVKARDVPINQRPPFNDLPLVTRPDCYRAQGYVRVRPDALTSKGFWK